MDVPDIQIIMQYRAMCNLNTLWQWFGQAAHGVKWGTTAILLVEKKNVEEECLLKVERAVKKKEKKKEGIGNEKL